MIRFYKFPKWQQWFYPKAIFDFYDKKISNQKVIYLTFDDGPIPGVTEKILDILETYNAKATFFCIGENVKKKPKLYQTIIDKGHAVGNHSMNHINGFKTSKKKYIEDVLKAKKFINSNLFRPPYGKYTPKQHKALKKLGFQTVFWSYLTYDFDSSLKSEKRIINTISNCKNGSILVFHDNLKDLTTILKNLSMESYTFLEITTNSDLNKRYLQG